MTEKKKQFRETKRQSIGNARRLRKEMTPAEKRLGTILRSRNLYGYKFRRQHPIQNYIADFYCAEAKLILEIDGAIHTHPEKKKQDQERTKNLEEMGYHILRLTNDEVLENLEGAAEKILETIEAYLAQN